jgi:hypothetical protein
MVFRNGIFMGLVSLMRDELYMCGIGAALGRSKVGCSFCFGAAKILHFARRTFALVGSSRLASASSTTRRTMPGLGEFGVADLAGLLDFHARQPKIGDRSHRDIYSGYILPRLANLAPRRIVFIGEPTLRLGLDFQCIGLGAIDGGDQVVTSPVTRGDGSTSVGGEDGKLCRLREVSQ